MNHNKYNWEHNANTQFFIYLGYNTWLSIIPSKDNSWKAVYQNNFYTVEHFMETNNAAGLQCETISVTQAPWNLWSATSHFHWVHQCTSYKKKYIYMYKIFHNANCLCRPLPFNKYEPINIFFCSTLSTYGRILCTPLTCVLLICVYSF